MKKLLISTLLAATVVIGGSLIVANTAPDTTVPRVAEHSNEQSVRQIDKQNTSSLHEGRRNR